MNGSSPDRRSGANRFNTHTVPARALGGLTYLGQSRDYNRDMLKNWWRKRQQDREQQEQKDAAAIAEARREAELERSDPDLSDTDKLTPIFKNTDWTGGGPL